MPLFSRILFALRALFLLSLKGSPNGAEEDFDIGTIPQFTMINKRWLDELGMDVPTTTAELHDVLVAFAANDMSAKVYGNAAGTTIPLSCAYDQWCFGQDMFYAAFGFTPWSDVCKDLHLKGDGTVEFLSAQPKYREADRGRSV